MELEVKGIPGQGMGAWCGAVQGTGLRMGQRPVRLELPGEVGWASAGPALGPEGQEDVTGSRPMVKPSGLSHRLSLRGCPAHWMLPTDPSALAVVGNTY